MNRRELVQRYFEVLRRADRGALESLLADDFTFTSPHDDHLDRAAYFERCWARAATFAQHEESLILVEGDDAVVHYDGVGADGAAFRNIERLRFLGDRIHSVEVFFGGPHGGGHGAEVRAAIQTVLDQRKEALEAKDARLVAAKHVAEPVTFALAPPLVAEGDVEQSLAAWFRTWRGLLNWETRDVQIAASGDVAFVSALERMAGTKADGHEVSMWFRTTLGLRKIGNEWKITHEHQSVPFYMDGSLRAAVDLTPADVQAPPTRKPRGEGPAAHVH